MSLSNCLNLYYYLSATSQFGPIHQLQQMIRGSHLSSMKVCKITQRENGFDGDPQLSIKVVLHKNRSSSSLFSGSSNNSRAALFFYSYVSVCWNRWRGWGRCPSWVSSRGLWGTTKSPDRVSGPPQKILITGISVFSHDFSNKKGKTLHLLSENHCQEQIVWGIRELNAWLNEMNKWIHFGNIAANDTFAVVKILARHSSVV